MNNTKTTGTGMVFCNLPHLRGEEGRVLLSVFWAVVLASAPARAYEIPDPQRWAIVNASLDEYEQKIDRSRATLGGAEPMTEFQPRPTDVSRTAEKPVLAYRLKGLVRSSFGIESSGDTVWRRANADLNERNFRILSSSQLNNRSNTFDPAIFSRVKLELDAAIRDALSMHLNVTADPWSYTGKTDVAHVTGVWGVDSADVQYLYWGNTGYTVNRTVFTQQIGDAFGLPETKVKGRKVPAQSVTSVFGDTFDIPEMKVKTVFQPVRELWFDIKPGDAGKVRLFPMAYQDQALTSDDPLHLSNNKTYWEESPWLRSWTSGIFNPVPNDFTKGKWDRTLAFFTRDSDGLRLTALRGAALDLNRDDEFIAKAVIAAPKTLWEDYNDVTAVPGSLRVKQFMGERAYLGATGNMHLGLAERKQDAENYVGSVDTGILPIDGVKFSAEVARSISRNDMLTPDFRSEKEGQAYYVSLEASTASEDMLKKDYYGLVPQKLAEELFKTKLYFAGMEQGFETSLSNYHETRDDAFWSRHLTFYPSIYRNMPETSPTTSEYDQMPFAIGNGLDYGRKVIGWRGDAWLADGFVKALADVRHVLTENNRRVETVARTEVMYKVNDRLTTKALALWHDLPKTVENQDPFIVSGETGKPLANTAVRGGNDPSLKTASLGARYELTEWAAVNGVWEHTNDITLGSDNFPRGDLNSSSFATFKESGRTYREEFPFLYNQGYFDQAPYEYFNVFKVGLLLKPLPVWQWYFDYTRNPNKFAGNIDDNMQHFGAETSYVPNNKWGLFARYTLSQGYDLNRLVYDGVLQQRKYHNVFLEGQYRPTQLSRMSLQYGVGPAYSVATSVYNPQLAYYTATVLQTQQLIQVLVEQKF